MVGWSRRQVVTGIAAGTAFTGVARAQAPLTKATVAVGGQGLFYMTLYMAVDGGFFRDQGLDITILDVGSGTRQAAAIMGGSAELSTIGLEQNMQANARGGGLIAVCSCFNAFPMSIVLSKAAVEKNGFVPGMPLDEKIKRLHGLRLGISSPGSSTEGFVRTLLLSRGLSPENEVSLQPVGGGAPMLAALEAGGIDGFVWGPPFSTTAVTKDNAVVVIDPMNGEAAHADPDKAAASIRARFPGMDDTQYRAAFDIFVKGVPTTPLIDEARYNRTLATLNISVKPPLVVPYSAVVVPDLALEAMRG